MSNNNGYIKLRRSSQDNPLYFAEPFTRWQARQDLLLLANHSDGFFYIRGNRIDVERGQVARGEKDLCARRKWSRDKTKKFLNDLEKMQQIRQQKNRLCSVYIIVNYDRYQTTDHTTDHTTEKHQTRQQKNINNKNKEEYKEGKEKEFDLLWDLWSSKLKEYNNTTSNDRSQGGKTKAKEKYMKLNVPIEKVENAINGYFQERIHTKEYPKHMVTWLNQGGYNDDYEIVNRDKSDDERIKEYERLGYAKFKEKYNDDEYRKVKDLRTKQAFSSSLL